MTERTAEELEAVTASKQITITDAVFIHSSLSRSLCARRGMASVTALTSMCITTRRARRRSGREGTEGRPGSLTVRNEIKLARLLRTTVIDKDSMTE